MTQQSSAALTLRRSHLLFRLKPVLLAIAVIALGFIFGVQSEISAQVVAIGEPTPAAQPTTKTRTNRTTRTVRSNSKTSKPDTSKSGTPTNGDTTVSIMGAQVQVDSAGRLRPPTPEEARMLADKMRAVLSSSAEGLSEVPAPGGGVMIDLEGRFQSFSVAKRNADGSVSTECVTTMDELNKFLGIGNDASNAKPKVAPTTQAASSATTKAAPRAVKSSRSTARHTRLKKQK